MNNKKGTSNVSQQMADTLRRVAKELEKQPEFAPIRNPKIYEELAKLYGTNKFSVRRILNGMSHKVKERA